MNPVYATYTNTGAQPPIILDHAVAPFTVNVACVVTTSATYGLQYTLDDPNLEDPNDTLVVWFYATNIPSGSTTTLMTSFSAPIRAVRANIADNGGSLAIKVIQGYSIT